nr:cupin-like domain-containing protein [Massilia sp. JS1662]
MREISGATPGALTDAILTATEPLVLRGLVASWPLVKASLRSQREGIAYLRRFYQGEVVRALIGPPEIAGRYFYNDDISGFNFDAVNARLDAILDQVLEHLDDPCASTFYVGSTTVDTCLPGFREENDLDLGDRDPLVSVWTGNRSRIPAHQDLPDNLACVAAGRRRFTLFPPEQLSNLYIGPLEFTPANQPISLVDFHQPDLVKFPRFAEAMAHAQVAELLPGDAIFIPSMWWHHIEGLDSFNVLINYWWRQSPGYMDAPVNTLMHAILTLRELPPPQRLAWQEVFRHYIFEADGSETAHIPEPARGVLGPLDLDKARSMRAAIMQKLKR